MRRWILTSLVIATLLAPICVGLANAEPVWKPRSGLGVLRPLMPPPAPEPHVASNGGLCRTEGWIATSGASGNVAWFHLYDFDGNFVTTVRLNSTSQPNLVAEMRALMLFFWITVWSGRVNGVCVAQDVLDDGNVVEVRGDVLF